MYGWLTFYHQGMFRHYCVSCHDYNQFMPVLGHEVAKEFKSIITDLQIRLQRVSLFIAFSINELLILFIGVKTRANYETTQNETESLMNKMLEVRKNVSNATTSLFPYSLVLN